MTIKPAPKIELRYKADQIGQANIDRVCRYYTNNVQLHDIIRMVNGHNLDSHYTLSLVDVYTILNVAMKDKKVKQRNKFLEIELRISEFVTVYRAWKQGVKPKEILALLPSSKIAIERVLKSLNLRTREDRMRLKEVSTGAASMILFYATPAFMDGEAGWWIPASAVPKDLLDETGLKAPSLEEDILIEHRRTFEEPNDSSEIQQVIRETEDVPEDVPETVSSGNNSDPSDPGRLIQRQEPEPARVYQSEEEILSDEVYQIPVVPEEAEQPEQIETAKPIKDQINDFL